MLNAKEYYLFFLLFALIYCDAIENLKTVASVGLCAAGAAIVGADGGLLAGEGALNCFINPLISMVKKSGNESGKNKFTIIEPNKCSKINLDYQDYVEVCTINRQSLNVHLDRHTVNGCYWYNSDEILARDGIVNKDLKMYGQCCKFEETSNGEFHNQGLNVCSGILKEGYGNVGSLGIMGVKNSEDQYSYMPDVISVMNACFSSRETLVKELKDIKTTVGISDKCRDQLVSNENFIERHRSPYQVGTIFSNDGQCTIYYPNNETKNYGYYKCPYKWNYYDNWKI